MDFQRRKYIFFHLALILFLPFPDLNMIILIFCRRINEYSPTDVSKANERSVNRRNNVRFNPKATIDILSQGDPPDELDDDQKRELVQKYIEVSFLSGFRCYSHPTFFPIL